MRRGKWSNSSQIWGVTFLALFIALIGVRQAQANERTPLDEIRERVTQAGSYSFTAEITQYDIPQASPRSIGAEIAPDELFLQGSTDLSSNLFNMTLWSRGGSVLDGASGVAIKNDEQGRLWAKQGESKQGDSQPTGSNHGESESWQEIEDFSTGVIPAGDFLQFLAGADNVVNHGAADVNGLTLTRYSYIIDSVAFATLMRDQIQQQMQDAGELLPGSQLELSETFLNMRGSGELWVGEDGLPVRQRTHLIFPGEDGGTVDATTQVDFTDFETIPTAPVVTVTPQLLSQLDLILRGLIAGSVVSLAAFIAVTRARRRWVYRVVSITMTFSLLFAQSLQTIHAAGIHERFQLRRDNQEAMRAEAEAIRQYEEQAANLWLDELSEVRTIATSPEFLAPVAVDVSSTADSDGDGLTDAQEKLLGTLIDVADTDEDGLSDGMEVAGFNYAGIMWYTNPRKADSNNDGQSDYAEWNIGLHQTWDLDNDQVPDLFDFDNDGERRAKTR